MSLLFMKFKDLKTSAWLLLLLMSFQTWVMANEGVPAVEDLGRLKQQIISSHLPVLIMFSTEDCEYCAMVRKHYLLPMIHSGKYKTKILFRELFIEDFSYLRNEKGVLITGDTLALKYDVDVTPTILFIDANWRELTKRIVGISNLDYFDHLLEERILQANKSMNKI